ncbi:hypothetical protein P7F88_19675 [Vibrio hannami]|uniref:hypothetical protein n=1 Tax=Vibrio hannami TaxID=2717094 RepID=UPI00240F2A54|nr:hypothetical protein [Vibrio hannami]MDG3088172.1 hypothetical protein [Vibrio hannami]
MMILVYALGFVILSTSLYWKIRQVKLRNIAKEACYLHFYNQLDEAEPSAKQVEELNQQVIKGWNDPVERQFMISLARKYTHIKADELRKIAIMSGYEC